VDQQKTTKNAENHRDREQVNLSGLRA